MEKEIALQFKVRENVSPRHRGKGSSEVKGQGAGGEEVREKKDEDDGGSKRAPPIGQQANKTFPPVKSAQ